MQKPYVSDEDESQSTLRDWIEVYAIGLANSAKNEKIEVTLLKKSILDSLVSAYSAIKP